MNEDTELLRRFAEDGSQEAFGELVRRKIDLVYAAALRQTGGDAHLAQDVTQGVFLALACRAAALQRHAVLTGWLYQTTRFVAAKAVRTQARWQRREQEANTMSILSDGAQPAWTKLRPVIDEAMHELDEKDRAALLLRFFEGRPLAEVGAAIGLPENSARMRVERALAKLSVRLARRGITSTAAALGVALASQPAVVAPAGLAATILGPSVAAAAVGSGAETLAAWRALDFMNKTKITSVAAMAFAVAGTGSYLLGQQSADVSAPVVNASGSTARASLQAENERLKIEVSRLRDAVAAIAPSPLNDLRALVNAVQQKTIPPVMTLLRMNQDKLSPAVATLFDLTANEKAALEKTLIGTREQIGALAAANVASVENPGPAKVVVRFKTFPQEGGQVHDRVLTDLKQLLGSERFTALTTLMADRFETQLGSGFGATERTLTIDRRAGGRPDRPIYQVVDRVEGTLNSTSLVFSYDRAGLEQNYPGLAKHLPADF